MSPVVAGQTLADRIMFPEPTPGSVSSAARASPKASRPVSKLRKHATGGSTRRRASQVGRMMPELEKQMNSQEFGAGGRRSGAGAGAGAASAPFVFGSREGSVSLSWDAEQSNSEKMGTKMASLSSTFITACRNAERKHGGGTLAPGIRNVTLRPAPQGARPM